MNNFRTRLGTALKSCGLRTGCCWLIAAIAFIGPSASRAADGPILYANPDQEGAVRGDPDDLIILAGSDLASDDSVVYQALPDTTAALRPPAGAFLKSDAVRGTAPVVDHSNVPLALTVRLPTALSSGRSYGLWVLTPDGRWSNGVLINDARPKWLSPGFAYATQSIAGLPRYLKVVGRNLQPEAGHTTRVRLVGPDTVERTANSAGLDHGMLDHFVAKIALPERLRPGRYSVWVNRDGRSWVQLRGQTLEVEPDSMPPPELLVSDPQFGSCKPDDDTDDGLCVYKALERANAIGGGTVVFGAGTWLISDRTPARLGSTEGLIVSRRVNIRGAGARRTVIRRTVGGASVPATPLFTLLGSNRVEGIHFRDDASFVPQSPAAPMIRLGPAYDDALTDALLPARRVDNIVITGNVFDRAHPGISAGGVPIDRLFITYNEFGAYDFGLIVRGDRFDVRDRFQISDTVIAHNVFKPGAYLDIPARQGAIASQLGASLRMDFSDNIADGASRRYLDDGDAGGWRAAFFWNLTGQNELLLISQNSATCTGDKDGDGEAIAFDNDGNTFGFGHAVDVIDATAGGVTADGLFAGRQSGRSVGADYYVGHDVQVVAGPGIGQVRRIRGYRQSQSDRRVYIDVSPDWDVAPQTASRIIVGRQFRQAYIVDNLVDERRPLCQKSNRTNAKAGVIGLWAQTAGAVIAGNKQFDSDGILANQNYNAEDETCADCDINSFVQSFFEIRGNLIDGEYDWDSDCSHSGIYIGNSAAPVPGSRPPTMNFGGAISHNVIRRADGLRGGGISIPLTWHQGPPPHNWPVINNLLIFHNSLRDLDGPPPRHACDDPQLTRIGINLYRAEMVHATILYGNECSNVTMPVHDGGIGTVRLCKPGAANSCECKSHGLPLN